MGILNGQVAVVLGASRGIGRGIAISLAREGATIFVAARTLEAGETRPVGPDDVKVPGTLEESVLEINKAGGEAFAIYCDVRDDASIERLIENVIESHGRLDILACSLLPDDQFEGHFWELPLSAWDNQFIVGPRAYYAAARVAAPHMSKAGSGLMVFISSPGGAFDFYSIPYCVARAATDRLSQAIDSELREKGVTAVSLWPSYIRTERVLQAHAGEAVGFSVEPEVDLELEANSPQLVGSVIAHLAADPDKLALGGGVQLLADLSTRYDLLDDDDSKAVYPEGVEKVGPIAPSAYMKRLAL